ncbi:Hsp70 family protein [Williamsia sp.]|uniref:Hsp70 family protein n=1 Tax=Williamsia sp. TaxID=1872085 RepID=UPI002F91DB37
MYPTAIGVAIGAQRLTATTLPTDSAPPVIRTPVLTLSPDRPVECGTASENPRVRGDGVTVSGFVERVGDPVPITSPDGKTHRAEMLTAAAVKSVIRGLLGQSQQPPPIVVAYPSYWPPNAVSDLRGALPAAGLPASVQLHSGMAAALAQIRRHPDFPSDGIIGLVDAGATGTSVALADAGKVQLIGQPLRVDEPAGVDFDHALMRHVLGLVVDDPHQLSNPDPNLLGALSALRAQCVAAKEQLSSETAATIAVDLPMFGGDVRITRAEFEDLAAEPLGRTVDALRELLDRESVPANRLGSVFAFGGSAAIPLLTQRLSGDLHLPVSIDNNPHLTIAAGAARIAAASVPRPATDSGPTRVPRPVPFPIPGQGASGPHSTPQPASGTRQSPPTESFPASPRPPTDTDPNLVPVRNDGNPPPRAQPRPALTFNEHHTDTAEDSDRRHGRRLVLIGVAAALVLAAAAGTAFALSNNDSETPEAPAPSVSVSITTTPETTTEDTTTQEEVVIPEETFVPEETFEPPITTSETPPDSVDPGGTPPEVSPEVIDPVEPLPT